MKRVTIELGDKVYDAHRELYKQVLADLDMSESEHSFEEHLAVSLSHTTEESNEHFYKEINQLQEALENSVREIFISKDLDELLFKILMRYLHTQGVKK